MQEQKSFESGIPLTDDVLQGVNTQVFSDLIRYSMQYLLKAAADLQSYPWIKDSFYQWSRIYEYPYVYSQIKERLIPKAKILDAGSGVTFFPFFLSHTYQIECVDQDDYTQVYAAINKKMSVDVSFKQANLTQLPFADGTFEGAYCISVLEHTNRYPEIIAEFARVLKPGGVLILSFDISLDANQFGVSQDNALKLLSCLKNSFVLDQKIDKLLENLKTGDVYSTHSLSSQGMYGLLPWPKFNWKQWLRSVIKRRPIVNNPNLTFCCLTASKI